MNLQQLFSLDGECIVVTGGYGYLGSAICKGLAGAGARVIVVGRSKDKFADAFSNVAKVYFQRCDVAETESVAAAFVAIHKQFGEITALVNNAHYGRGGAVDSKSDEAWSITLDGTLGSYHRCIREVLPFFRSRGGGGNIVNIASMYGVVAPDFDLYLDYPSFTNPPDYGAGKAGIIQMTKYFASLLGKEGIRVNALSPGPFPSFSVQKHAGFTAELAKRTTLNRIGVPEELIGAVVFLLSKSASFTTGVNLIVDGGWTIK